MSEVSRNRATERPDTKAASASSGVESAKMNAKGAWPLLFGVTSILQALIILFANVSPNSNGLKVLSGCALFTLFMMIKSK